MAKIINIKARQNTNARMATFTEGFALITELEMLANTDRIEPCLVQSARVNRAYTELLTCTGKPIDRTFDELFPVRSIQEYRDANGNCLPGAVVKICTGRSRCFVISHDDPDNCLEAQKNYLSRILIPRAIERVVVGLNEFFTPQLKADLPEKIGDSLREMLVALDRMYALDHGQATEELRQAASMLSNPAKLISISEQA